MAAGEHEPEPVVGEPALRTEAHGVLRRAGERAFEECQLLRVPAGAPDPIESAVSGDGRQPGTRVRGNAVPLPGLRGGQERIRDRLLGEVEVAAEKARQRGDDPPVLGPEGPVDGVADRGLLGRHAPADASDGMIPRGRTSIEPHRAPGHRAAASRAVSRSGASMR